MSLWSRLRSLVAFHGPAEQPLVRAHFDRRHPDWEFLNCSIRAVEADRTVVAVHYREREVRGIVFTYLLYAVLPGGAIEELDCSSDSPYWIRGLK